MCHRQVLQELAEPTRSNTGLLALMLALLLGACEVDRPVAPEPASDAPSAASGSGNFGRITIALDVQPNSRTDVGFTAMGRKLPNFSLDDDSDPGLPGTRTFAKLKPGTYTVQQAAVAGGTLSQLTCTSQPNGGSGSDNNTVNLSARSVVIQLERDEAVACTFVLAFRSWRQGDVLTHRQGDWDEVGAGPVDLYSQVYASRFGVLEVGTPGTAGHSIVFGGQDGVLGFLPATGAAGPLTGDLVDPTSSSAGAFGGDVVALALNLDFAEAGMLGRSGIPLGDLGLCRFDALPALNGLSVRALFGIVSTLLGGGSGDFTIAALAPVVEQLNGAFAEGGVVRPFAQQHLARSSACEAVSWQDGDVITYTQQGWGQSLLELFYNQVYGPSFGVIELGIPGLAGHSMVFGDGGSVQAYLPATGPNGVLMTDAVNPTSTSAGGFGGEALALRLNIDFAEAGLLPAATAVRFGDLTLCDFEAAGTLAGLNGRSVRDALGLVSTVLGGGTNGFGLLDLAGLANQLNGSFAGGAPTAFAQEHLVSGTCP